MSTDSSLVTSAASPGISASIEVYTQLQTVRNVLAPDLSDQELQLFALVAQRSGLDPFAKQIYAVKRGGRVTFQTGIDGYRSTAERTREYDGQDEPVFEPADWEDRQGDARHPDRATVTVYRWRHGQRVPQSSTARWDSLYPGPQLGQQWRKMPDVMLAKCAEAAAFRKAFPYVLADIYVDAEMNQAGPGDNAGLVAAAAQPTATERVAARRAALEPSEAIEGEAREVDDAPTPAAPAALTHDELKAELARLGIGQDYAVEVSKRLFPREPGVPLSDEQRAGLVAALVEEQAAEPAAAL